MKNTEKIFSVIGIIFSVLIVHAALTTMLGDIYVNALAGILVILPVIFVVKFLLKMINK